MLFIASMALVSIVLISEQLISRHLGRQLQMEEEEAAALEAVTEKPRDIFEIDLDIVTIEEWAEMEVTSFPLQEKVTFPSVASETAAAAAPATVIKYMTPESKMEVIEDGIFFSDGIEAMLPPGPADHLVQDAMQQLRSLKIVEATSPSHQYCGRQKNRYIKFSDGNVGCARNRETHMEYVQGEVMAFYLARLLGLTNTPAVVLSQVGWMLP